MASAEASPELPECKSVVLRVSIHCEGCKKKVKRVLTSVQGVYECDIDARQNKVTVKTNVDPGVLLKKLHKSGKQAQLMLPEKKNPANQIPDIKENQSKEPNKPKDPPAISEKKSSETTAVATKSADAKAKSPEAEAKAVEAPSLEPTVEQKASTKENDPKATQKSAENSNPPPEIPKVDDTKAKKVESPKEESNSTGDNSEKGTSEQKEKTKQRKSEVEYAHEEPQNMYASPMYQPYSQPTPTYVMSYNMAHPTASRSLYATVPPPPPPSQGYMYSSYPPPQEHMYSSYAPPPPEYYSYYGPPSEPSSSSPPQDSYDMFNDENANSCTVM